MWFYWVGLGLESCTKKLFAEYNSFWCHFTVHICGYIYIIAYMDLTIDSKKMLAGSRLDELKSIFLLCVIFIMCK